MSEVRYLTSKEYADKFKTTTRHVLDLARAGRLKGIKIGHLWRFEDTPPLPYRKEKDAGSSTPEEIDF